MKATWFWTTFMFQKRKVKLKGREGDFKWNKFEQDTLHWDAVHIISDEICMNSWFRDFLKQQKNPQSYCKILCKELEEYI